MEALKGAFLHRQIGFDVHVGGRSALVAKPQCDHCDVDARLQKMHCGSVADRVRGDWPTEQLWAALGGGFDVERETLGDVRTAHRRPVAVREHRRGICYVAKLTLPDPEQGCGRPPQGNRALLASLAVDVDTWGAFEDDVADAQANNLGYPCSCVVEHGEQRLIPPPSPVPRVGSVEDGLHFVPGQEAEQRLVATLHRYGQCSLDDRQGGDIVVRSVAEEGPHGGEARVAATRTVTTIPFKVIEEGQHQCCIEIGKFDGGRWLGDMLLGKEKQQPERVSVRGDGPRAGGAVPREVVGEVALQQRREGRRCSGAQPSLTSSASEANSSKRRPATAINSGTPVRYQ